MKKLVSILTMSVMSLCMFGCGNSDQTSNSGIEISETQKVAPTDKPVEDAADDSSWLDTVIKIDTYTVDFSEGDYFEVKFSDQSVFLDENEILWKVDGARGTLILESSNYYENTILEIKVYQYEDHHWVGTVYDPTPEILANRLPNIVITPIEGGPLP